MLAASLSTAVALLVIGQGPEIIASSVSSDSGEAVISESVTAGGVGARFVLNDILHLWGCACDTTDDCIQADAVGAINAAMQYIHANGKELPYLTKRTRYYWLESGYSGSGAEYGTTYPKAIALDADVQHVCGYVRCVIPYWHANLPYIQTLHSGMPLKGAIFTSGVRIDYNFTYAAQTATDGVAYGTDYTDVATLQAALQAKTINGAVCYVHDGPFGLIIAWDSPPQWIVDMPISGVVMVAPDDPNFVFTDGGATQYTATYYDYANPPNTLKPLQQVATRYEFDNWEGIYGTDVGSAYFLEREHKDTADSCRIRLLVTKNDYGEPVLLAVDVAVEPGRITWADYAANSTVPIPHQYVESLLVPISRWYAMGSHRYRQRDRHQSLLDQYARALQMLGIVDPKVEPSEKGTEK